MIGLLGDVRIGEVRERETARGGAVLERVAERSDSLTLGGNGLARGDGVCTVVPAKMLAGCERARFGGDRGDGDNGDLGDGLGDFVTRRNLEGERDRERRSDLTAEVTST